MIKRIIDIIGSILGLALILPFTPIIVLAIKLDSKGPVLVKLPRVSGGRVVGIYKFRSMIHGAHQLKIQFAHLNERRDGPFFKIKNDPRLTRVGKILRQFRLDEFPQLINVLKGELSLVGPRPHEPEEVQKYPAEHQPIILAKAGVTGLSQVNGASSLPFLKELELDAHYVKNQSLILDAKILAKTIKIIFTDPTAV
jgi:lipopolysaccharide/colanic/teichoic acid biosynthesis glycosyltransferase